MDNAYIVVTTFLNLQILPRSDGICGCQRLHDEGNRHIGDEGQQTQHQEAEEPSGLGETGRKR